MNFQLNQKQHGILSLLILVAITFMVYITLIAPALSKRQVFHADLAELQLQYSLYTQHITQLDALQKEVDFLIQNQPGPVGFLEDKQLPLAAADLQRLISGMITSNAGQVISTQVISESDSSKLFPEITIRLNLRADSGALQSILYQIRVNSTVLILDNLQIQAINAGRHRRPSRDREEDPNQMDVQFDVSAYVYRAAGP